MENPWTSSRSPDDDRRFRKLRVSLTDRCNHSCLYCDPSLERAASDTSTTATVSSFQPTSFYLNLILRLCREGGLKQVHLTGGEPTLYPYLVSLVSALKENGVSLVTMTSNGHRLEGLAHDLKSAGLDGVNVSLNSLNHKSYLRLNGSGNPDSVIKAIDQSIHTGLELKMNSTILKGYNEAEVVALLDFARGSNIRIRYIEFMAIGPMRSHFNDLYFSQDQILEKIENSYSIVNKDDRVSHAARYFILEDGYRFGIIANTADPFCFSCDRLRMDSRGLFYGCLSAKEGYPLSVNDNLDEFLVRAMSQKNHERFIGSDRSMRSIGG